MANYITKGFFIYILLNEFKMDVEITYNPSWKFHCGKAIRN